LLNNTLEYIFLHTFNFVHNSINNNNQIGGVMFYIVR